MPASEPAGEILSAVEGSAVPGAVCPAVTRSLVAAEGAVRPNSSPVITVGDVTKITAVTHSVTGFPLVLNQIRSVTAFTPIFHVVVLPGGIDLCLSV